MLCHPDISLPTNYALQIRMNPLIQCVIGRLIEVLARVLASARGHPIQHAQVRQCGDRFRAEGHHLLWIGGHGHLCAAVVYRRAVSVGAGATITTPREGEGGGEEDCNKGRCLHGGLTFGGGGVASDEEDQQRGAHQGCDDADGKLLRGQEGAGPDVCLDDEDRAQEAGQGNDDAVGGADEPTGKVRDD